MEPLRLMIYDSTCTGRSVGLSHCWFWGGRLYGALGRLHAWRGVSSWQGGLRWLASYRSDRPIGEVQFWGHGRWGLARIHATQLDRAALRGALARDLDAIRERSTPDALWWFRTCETIGAARGQDFAQAFSDRMGCSVAGHTHIIGVWQSGLHRLRPGERPTWSPEEGLREGSASEPVRARWSWPGYPNTIHCLDGAVPEGW